MKLPRDLTGRDVASALKRLGFIEVRQSGSHIRMRMGHCNVTVPEHDPLKPKTLQSVLRQAQIELDQLLRAL